MRRSKRTVNKNDGLVSASEHDEQAGLVTWFRARFPRVLIMAIPNGGFRSIATARRLKAEGVVAGVPDLFVPEWLLWVEMKKSRTGKSRASRLSPAQDTIHAHLKFLNHEVIVGYGATDASAKILKFLDNSRQKVR